MKARKNFGSFLMSLFNLTENMNARISASSTLKANPIYIPRRHKMKGYEKNNKRYGRK